MNTWPEWIEDLKARYLADASNAFVLVGELGARWEVDGASLSCLEVLERFLVTSRAVLATVSAEHGLTFSTLSDDARFQHIVAARDALDDRPPYLRRSVPDEALALVWRAATVPGTAQGYLIPDLADFAPGWGRPKALPAGVPPLETWPGHAELRPCNTVIVALAPSPARVRASVLAAWPAVQVVAPAFTTPTRSQLAPEPPASAPAAPPPRVAPQPEELSVDDLLAELDGPKT